MTFLEIQSQASKDVLWCKGIYLYFNLIQFLNIQIHGTARKVFSCKWPWQMTCYVRSRKINYKGLQS